MILSSIVAASENNAIGKHNQLPWYLPEDLKFFKKATLGSPVLMGRKTFESLGKPLPGRLNIVITQQADLPLPEGVLLFQDIESGIKRMEEEVAEEGFIIGGGTIFEQTMNIIDRIYFTRVHTIIDDATAFFPEIDHTHWKLTKEESHETDEKHAFSFAFLQYERINL